MRGKTVIVAATLLLASTPAAASWLEARSPHFIVYSEAGEPALRDMATKLERFDQGMRRLRDLPDEPSNTVNPLTVFVVPDAAAVRRLCLQGASSANACTNVAGFYNGHAGGSVAFTPRRSGSGSPFDLDAQTVLFHEYSHFFMFQNYSAVYPAWFTEGFAEFNSTAEFDSDGSIGFGKPAYHRFLGLMRGTVLPLASLFGANDLKLKPDQRESLYGRGWLLTHYLTFEPSRRGQLSAYLKAVNDGTPSLAAATTNFGDLRKLEADLDAYLHRRTMRYVRLARSETPIGAITIRTLGPGENAMMPIRLRSKRGVNATTAQALDDDARRIAASFANDPAVQDALAEAEFDAAHVDLAEAAADRALAVAPADQTAMLYKGRSLMRRAAAAKSTDPTAWRTARSWFVKANRLQPDAAEPLMLFYRSYLVARVEPTPNAIMGLRRAFVLAPEDAELRFMLARQDLIENQLAEARNVLLPLALDPHADPDNPAARLIARIEAREPDLARPTVVSDEENE